MKAHTKHWVPGILFLLSIPAQAVTLPYPGHGYNTQTHIMLDTAGKTAMCMVHGPNFGISRTRCSSAAIHEGVVASVQNLRDRCRSTVLLYEKTAMSYEKEVNAVQGSPAPMAQRAEKTANLVKKAEDIKTCFCKHPQAKSLRNSDCGNVDFFVNQVKAALSSQPD